MIITVMLAAALWNYPIEPPPASYATKPLPEAPMEVLLDWPRVDEVCGGSVPHVGFFMACTGWHWVEAAALAQNPFMPADDSDRIMDALLSDPDLCVMVLPSIEDGSITKDRQDELRRHERVHCFGLQHKNMRGWYTRDGKRVT